MKMIQRSSLLLSLREATDKLIGERSLATLHTDPSFLFFDPRSPNAWLTDPWQAEWAIHNHKQIDANGNRRHLSRILLFPKDVGVVGESHHVYWAAAKATVHFQLFEGIKVGAFFVRKGEDFRRFNFTLCETRHGRVAWPSNDYYAGASLSEVAEANTHQLEEIRKRLDAVSNRVIWLASYVHEHFERGARVSLPESWRKFLFGLQGGKCGYCLKPLGRNSHIDHVAPLHPRESNLHLNESGNSTLFNLAVLCSDCNLDKSNKDIAWPEKRIPELIWDFRLQDYFRASLIHPPDSIRHELPEFPTIQRK